MHVDVLAACSACEGGVFQRFVFECAYALHVWTIPGRETSAVRPGSIWIALARLAFRFNLRRRKGRERRSHARVWKIAALVKLVRPHILALTGQVLSEPMQSVLSHGIEARASMASPRPSDGRRQQQAGHGGEDRNYNLGKSYELV